MQVAKNKIAVAVFAAVVLVGIWVFSAGISDSPKKSLSAIEKAVKKRDIETFEKYVDLQSFYSEGFDSFLLASIKWERPDEEVNIDDMGFMMMFKSPIVQEMVAFSKKAVEKGEIPDTDSLGKLGDEMDTLGVKAWEFKRAGSAKKSRVTAIVPVTIRDRQVEKDFVLDIELHKTDEGIWRVKKIANAENVILARFTAAKAKLNEVNAGILKEMAGAVEISDVKNALELKQGSFYSSHYVTTSFRVRNKGDDRNMTTLGAKITAYSASGDILYTDSSTWGKQKDTGQRQWSVFTTRKFLDKQKSEELSKKENQGGKIEVTPFYIKFSDGTELRELSELPPYKTK